MFCPIDRISKEYFQNSSLECLYRPLGDIFRFYPYFNGADSQKIINIAVLPPILGDHK